MNTIKHTLTMSLLAVMSLLAPLTARAATYYVATNGIDTNPGTSGSPFKTIQHGIDAATNSDTIQVAAGNYLEHVTWHNKGLTLQGAGPGQSLIDGGQNGVCVNFVSDVNYTGPASAMTGFTIQNGWNPNFGGGMVNVSLTGMTVSNCAFVGNWAFAGGAMFIQGSPTVTHCLFTGNTAQNGAAIFNGSSSATISDCVFDHNAGSASGAMYNQDSNPRAIRCIFSNNDGGYGGGMYNKNSSPTVSECVFVGNNSGDILGASVGVGGAIYNVGQTITNCQPLVVNCTFNSNNVTGRGGAMYSSVASPTLVNCTFAANTHIAVVNESTTAATIANCVFWGNTNPTNGPTAILDDNKPSVTTYSDVQGGWPGIGNINADPLFMDDAAGNLRLQPNSPCINAGNALATNLPATDFDGAPRVVGGAPDMGTFESTGGAWFVDRTLGSDGNAGTAAAPFQTVTAANNAAANGNSIYIKPGNYGSDHPRITKTLRLINWGEAGLARIGQP